MPKFHNRDKALSYNAKVNFLIFQRGTGKSFAYKHLVISKFLETGKQFVYLRRYKNEISLAKNEFFNDMRKHFPNHKLETKGRYFYIDDKKAGYCYALSLGSDLKSVALPDVGYIIFDEVVPEGTYRDYLPNECMQFASVVSSVFRHREIKIFMLANKVSSITPYQVFFNIPPFDKTFYDKKHSILIFVDEDVAVDFEADHELNDFEVVFKDTDYFGYNSKNETLIDETSFVAKRPLNSKLQFLIKIGKDYYGCYYADGGRIWFDNNTDKTHPIKFTYDLDNLKETEILYNNTKNYASTIKLVLELGGLYYANVKTKLALQDFIHRI